MTCSAFTPHTHLDNDPTHTLVCPPPQVPHRKCDRTAFSRVKSPHGCICNPKSGCVKVCACDISDLSPHLALLFVTTFIFQTVALAPKPSLRDVLLCSNNQDKIRHDGTKVMAEAQLDLQI